MAKSTKAQTTAVPSTTRLKRQQTAPVTKSTANDVSTTNASLTHGDIAMRAYELYLAGGAIPGRDVDHWLEAESELRDRAVASGS
jgi:Protein of unknown function (DUF2934)